MTFQDDNGNILQFDGDFAITKRSVSFSSGEIKGDVSITFSVDNNSVNRNILNYDGPQMLNQIAWVKQPFNRIRNGNVLDRGYIVIQSDNGKKLKCFYVSGNSNWLQIFEFLITEIEWPRVKSSNVNGFQNPNTVPYDKYWRLVGVPNSNYAVNETDGIVFPFVDWCYNLNKGNDLYHNFGIAYLDSTHDNYTSAGNTPPLETFFFDSYPCLYIHSLVNQIVSAKNIKIDGDLFGDALYKSLIITPHNGLMTRSDLKTSYAVGSSQAGFINNTFVQYTSFNSEVDPYNTISPSGYTSNGVYGVIVKIDITSTVSLNDEVAIYKNGSQFFTSASIVPNAVYNSGGKIFFSTLFVYPGDVLSIWIKNTSGVTVSHTMNASFEIPKNIIRGDILNPSNFIPALKSIDILKFVFNLFGCSVYYDDVSKTLSANIIDNIQNSDDWSDYYISHSVDYTKNSAANNYIKYTQNDIDSSVIKYNNGNSLKFGDGNIETTNTLNDSKTIFELPVIGSMSGKSTNGSYLANVPLINLTDGDPIPFSQISSSGNFCLYTVPDGSIFVTGEIVRISNSAGKDRGYFRVFISGSGASVIIEDYPFTVTDTGNIYKQTINFNEVGARILSVKPNTDFTNISAVSSWKLNGFTGTQTKINASYFTKNKIGLPIDNWKNNLSIDNPNDDSYIDPTVKELYYNNISSFIKNPPIECLFNLPEAVYQSYKFDRFVYIKTKDLTGYFFVDIIENYVDSDTPVRTYLYMK